MSEEAAPVSEKAAPVSEEAASVSEEAAPEEAAPEEAAPEEAAPEEAAPETAAPEEAAPEEAAPCFSSSEANTHARPNFFSSLTKTKPNAASRVDLRIPGPFRSVPRTVNF